MKCDEEVIMGKVGWVIRSNEEFSSSGPTTVNRNFGAFYNRRNGFFDEEFDANKHLYSSLLKAQKACEELESWADSSIQEVKIKYCLEETK